MPRILAFDYGTKRTGIAVTDPLQIIATGLTVLHPKDVIAFLKKYMLTEAVELFVVGEPKQMDGSASQSAPAVNGFVRLLEKEFPQIPVKRTDERFTSKMASSAIAQSGMRRERRQDKSLVDQVSATLILQSYLESIAH